MKKRENAWMQVNLMKRYNYLKNFREIMRMQNILSGMQSFAKLFRTKKELRSCINSYGIFRKRISTVVNMQKK